jgi:hypothetical protein
VASEYLLFAICSPVLKDRTPKKCDKSVPDIYWKRRIIEA